MGLGRVPVQRRLGARPFQCPTPIPLLFKASASESLSISIPRPPSPELWSKQTWFMSSAVGGGGHSSPRSALHAHVDPQKCILVGNLFVPWLSLPEGSGAAAPTSNVQQATPNSPLSLLQLTSVDSSDQDDTSLWSHTAVANIEAVDVQEQLLCPVLRDNLPPERVDPMEFEVAAWCHPQNDVLPLSREVKMCTSFQPAGMQDQVDSKQVTVQCALVAESEVLCNTNEIQTPMVLRSKADQLVGQELIKALSNFKQLELAPLSPQAQQDTSYKKESCVVSLEGTRSFSHGRSIKTKSRKPVVKVVRDMLTKKWVFVKKDKHLHVVSEVVRFLEFVRSLQQV